MVRNGHPSGLGQPAPALDLPTATGGRKSLAEFRGRPVLVSFLGAANCPMCRGYVIRVIQARDAIASLGADVVFVAYHDPELVMSGLMRDLNLPYLLLVDESRRAYTQWGLGPVSLLGKLRPGLYLEMIKVLLQRPPNLGSAPNPNQRGGDFVVNRAGTLVFANRMKSFYDRAKIPDLLDALRTA
jgi:thioredoxin-dependent peroxiredoxin